MTSSPEAVRIGMVHYLNTAPIHEIWKEQQTESRWRLIEAHPVRLNQMLAANEIDLGFVSSHEYGVRPQSYQLLADLTISANGPVGSVFLFSDLPPERLNDLPVLLSSESRTSVCLVRIILELFYGIKPDYRLAPVEETGRQGAAGILAIGDQAIRLKQGGDYRYCLDLGETWKQHTGLPFVYAVCAVRDDFLKQHPLAVEAVHRRLIVCRDQGIRELSRVCRKAAPRIPMDFEACRAYLRAIEYDLSPEKITALETFFGYLVDLGEAGPGAVPLRIKPMVDF